MELMLEFERPILELEKKLKDLRDLAQSQSVDLGVEIKALEKRLTGLLEETYSQLTPWQKVQVSRHPNRPYTKDYIDALFTDFQELHGDRSFGEDAAIMGGTALFNGTPVMVIGHQKGRNTKQKMERNFGMPRPEGYRKAIRLMELASRFRLPLIHFIDTPGAYPGLDAEERGQAEAIADCIRTLFTLDTPTISVVIGEGGSGGALALSATDEVHMLEFSTYSVISPESCASILWNDSTLAERAAERIKLTSSDLLRFGVIDAIVSEPLGGAHRNWEDSFRRVGKTLEAFRKQSLKLIQNEKAMATQKENRYQKYRAIGQNQINFSSDSKKSTAGAGKTAASSKKKASAKPKGRRP
jgi:acetyl-CoA carboxylase carboxyl transferase subunit alpha